jgi:hypothetical protein
VSGKARASRQFSRSSSKLIAYIAIMAALGNTLAVLSTSVVKFGWSQVALDLSHLGTFLAAIPGGAFIGCITGALIGIYPALYFGPLGMLGILGVTLIPGKAMTGLFSGLVQRYLKRPFLSVVIGYVPESLFTIWVFMGLVPLIGIVFPVAAVFAILVKAWIEILFMAFVMESVFLSRGIVQMLRTIFPKWDYTPLSEL